jgi:hypothetical protein
MAPPHGATLGNPPQTVARPSSTAWQATIASPAGFITGTDILIDGGWCAQ